jgi:hypothetical protein
MSNNTSRQIDGAFGGAADGTITSYDMMNMRNGRSSFDKPKKLRA